MTGFFDLTSNTSGLFDYDSSGNKILEKITLNNRQSRTTRYTYGANNELAEVVDPDNMVTSFEYDSIGRLKEERKPNNTKSVYSYTAAGLIETIKHVSTKNNELLAGYGYLYDPSGKRINQVDENGLVTSYSYDDAGRLLEVMYPLSKEKILESFDERMELGLSFENNLKERFNNDRSKFNLEFDFNDLDKSFKETEEKYKNRFKFKDFDNYKHGSFKNLAERFITRLDADNATLDSLNGLYDKLKLGRSSIKNNQPMWRETYAFDSNSNVIEKQTPLGSIDYVYNNMNQMVEAGNAVYAYDLNGNQIQRAIGDDIITFGYNGDNRLVKFNDGRESVEYAYDAFGRRNSVSKSIDKRGSRFDRSEILRNVYSGFGFNAVMEIVSDDRKGIEDITEFIYAGNRLIDKAQLNFNHKKTVAVDKRFYYQDVLGSTVLTADSKGKRINEFDYTVYGKPYGDRINNGERLFNGKPLDINTGLYNYGFRDYSSLTGRFTTSDPIQAGDNWYLYCGADPVNFVDLLGLCKLGGENNGNSAINYVNDGLNQVIQGNYTTKVNALGTTIQLASALIGADIIGDVRDTIYNLTHAEMTVESFAQTGISVLAILPVVGIVKYVDEVETVAKGVVKKVEKETDKYVNLASEERTQHILYGDAPNSGGHMFPGQPGKTTFPQDWSAGKIMHEISDIATDPNIKMIPQTGTGGLFTKAGNPARFSMTGVRDGVTIKVIIEPAGEGIITSFPL